MDHSVDELVKAVQENSTLEDGLVTLVSTLQAQVKAILAGSVVPPAVQAQINAVFDAVSADSAKATAALGTTPAGDPVPPVPASAA